jgi:hypothetical protein
MKFPSQKGGFCEVKLLFPYAYSTPLFGPFTDCISYTPIYEGGTLETVVNSLFSFAKENTADPADSSTCGAMLQSGQANLSRLCGQQQSAATKGFKALYKCRQNMTEIPQLNANL